MKVGLPIAILAFLALGVTATAWAADPDFGPNVLIFDPSTANPQSQISGIAARQVASQFGSNRYALLFKPGKYNLDVEVGFYTHVAGLGLMPDDVSITGAVRASAGWMGGNATCNFWRSAENLAVTPTKGRGTDTWAVSQGVSFRRMHVRGNLILAENGWSSGGFIADSRIDGDVNSASQQQWFSRNSEWSDWRSGVWNMVFVGTNHPPGGNWPGKPYTIVDKAPITREKPFLCVDERDRFEVMVPPLQTNSAGTSWAAPGTPIPIEAFYLAHERDTAATINAALATGKNLILTPGIYRLDAPLKLTRADTVVLGLGYPTLIAEKGTAVMEIADVNGVKVSGILFEAGPMESPTLLQVGEKGSAASHAADPTFLYDLFARAGGANAGTAACFFTINSSNVVCDNFWLWRADHGAGAGWDANKNRNGLIVNGNDVTAYGLFVEHCQEYQTLWNGEGGRVYFYQSEMPYDPPSQEAWSHDGVKGYASYKVAANVKTHEAWGLGVYSYFTSAAVVSESAFEAPVTPGVKFHHLVIIRLGGQGGSGISHILNDEGSPAIATMKSTMP